MVKVWFSVMIIFIISQRLFELHIASQNSRVLLRAGAKEYGSSHYPLFFILHVGWLIGLILEVSWYGSLSSYWIIYLGLFACSEILRYWAMLSLGRFWNTRIFVIPGMELIRLGPYRFCSHPNYIAVAIELASVPLLFEAPITAVVATCLNLALLVGIRIPAEEKALAIRRSQ